MSMVNLTTSNVLSVHLTSSQSSSRSNSSSRSSIIGRANAIVLVFYLKQQIWYRLVPRDRREEKKTRGSAHTTKQRRDSRRHRRQEAMARPNRASNNSNGSFRILEKKSTIMTLPSERGFFRSCEGQRTEWDTAIYQCSIFSFEWERDSRVLWKKGKKCRVSGRCECRCSRVIWSFPLVSTGIALQATFSAMKESISTMILFWSYHRQVDESVMQIEPPLIRRKGGERARARERERERTANLSSFLRPKRNMLHEKRKPSQRTIVLIAEKSNTAGWRNHRGIYRQVWFQKGSPDER